MERLNNPFVIYGYKGADYFCDRDSETAIETSALANERNVVLTAPHRQDGPHTPQLRHDRPQRAGHNHIGSA